MVAAAESAAEAEGSSGLVGGGGGDARAGAVGVWGLGRR